MTLTKPWRGMRCNRGKMDKLNAPVPVMVGNYEPFKRL